MARPSRLTVEIFWLSELLTRVSFSGSDPGTQRLKARDEVRLMADWLAGSTLRSEKWLLLLPEWQTGLGSVGAPFSGQVATLPGDIIWLSGLVQSKVLAAGGRWSPQEVRWQRLSHLGFKWRLRTYTFLNYPGFFNQRKVSLYWLQNSFAANCGDWKSGNQCFGVLMVFVSKQNYGAGTTAQFSLSDPKSHRIGATAWAISADHHPLSGIFLPLS